MSTSRFPSDQVQSLRAHAWLDGCDGVKVYCLPIRKITRESEVSNRAVSIRWRTSGSSLELKAVSESASTHDACRCQLRRVAPDTTLDRRVRLSQPSGQTIALSRWRITRERIYERGLLRQAGTSDEVCPVISLESDNMAMTREAPRAEMMRWLLVQGGKRSLEDIAQVREVNGTSSPRRSALFGRTSHDPM